MIDENTSDGYHTFKELYDHRRALTRALMTCLPEISGPSKQHHPDDETSMFDGCFIVGIRLSTGEIRYHYGLEHWNEFEGIRELEYAPLWDGSSDTVERLHRWVEWCQE